MEAVAPAQALSDAGSGASSSAWRQGFASGSSTKACDRTAEASTSAGGGGGGSSSPVGEDGLLAGGLFAELRSWARYLLPSRYVAVFYPTPEPIALTMLKLAGVGPEDVVYDLGCGDGRILLAAARQMSAKRCVGIELDPDLAAAARRSVAAAGLSGRVDVLCRDAHGADVGEATVLALYLSDRGNRELLASVGATLRPGTRVVSLYFPVAGWEGVLAAHDTSAGIDVYLYVVPEPRRQEQQHQQQEQRQQQQRKQHEPGAGV